MKKYIRFFFVFISFFSALSVAAAQWGIKNDHVLPRKKRTPIEKFLSSETIYYYLNDESLFTSMEQATYQSLLIQAVKAWPTYALHQIEQSGRSEEFADIIPLLKSEVKLKKTSDRTLADIQLLAASNKDLTEMCGQHVKGCIVFDVLIVIPKIISYADKTDNYQEVLGILTHEVGHCYGLADQYYSGAEENASSVHSTSNRVDSDKSIMSYANELSCDDVDGFINLIDLNQQKMFGSYSTRAQKGWKSFCDNTMYKNAKVLNRSKYTIGNRTYEYDDQGNVKNTQYKLPFFYHNNPITHIHTNKYTMQVWYENWYLTFFEDKIVFQQGNHNFSANRIKNNDGSITWQYPFLEQKGSVTLKEATCSSQLYFDKHLNIDAYFNEQEKIYKTNTSFWNLFSDDTNSFFNTLLTDKADPLQATILSEPPFQAKGQCKVKYDFTELLTVEQGKVTSTNEKNMLHLVQETEIPYSDILLEAVSLCNKMNETEQQGRRYLEDTANICKFFSQIESQYYQ